ncbi:MAG: BON domain-containing protein [Rhodospirillales bacterium]|nr:BON domain-containing protein [Rhodospirillales bacterium]MCW8862875.1 BON domain-containing protein [Rhodospirillales bacterium]MCW8952363.1 BON domain-containing protein [Rhodospirillales bacterium]MCW8971161.1 BON domain-containing protein [Rhodospirillales bacterium]MCW9003014.1 BON domain-containing protein [Rhodospirillales bacterium]
MFRKTFFTLFLFAFPLGAGILGACTPIGAVVGAGAMAGVAASSERGIEVTAADIAIKARIVDKWVKHDHSLPIDFGITVYEGRALLTGMTDSEQKRADAVRLAWEVEGVKKVLNEIIVGEGGGIGGFTQDSWISAELKTSLTFDKAVLAINYDIETVGGTVYLIGIAQSQAELDHVIARARATKYVRQVVNHVRVKTATEIQESSR